MKIDAETLTKYLELLVKAAMVSAKVAKTGAEMAPAIAAVVKVWRSGKPPTKADHDALNASIDADEARLKAPE